MEPFDYTQSSVIPSTDILRGCPLCITRAAVTAHVRHGRDQAEEARPKDSQSRRRFGGKEGRKKAPSKPDDTQEEDAGRRWAATKKDERKRNAKTTTEKEELRALKAAQYERALEWCRANDKGAKACVTANRLALAGRWLMMMN